jgi:protein-tyrosine phosphatase
LYRRYSRIDWADVNRIVFVCQGNICRSPFAHKLAEQLIGSYPVASLGLATTTGTPAFDLAEMTARNFSIDLSQHRATDLSDFDVRDGDLFMVMEDRHAHQLGPKVANRNVQVALLGLWCRPRFALLYDPHKLSDTYFQTCFERIVRSVKRLAKQANGTPG